MHILEDHERRALRQPRALDPLRGAVALRLLAHDERGARPTGLKADDADRGRERIGAEREPADCHGGGSDLVDHHVKQLADQRGALGVEAVCLQSM